MWAGLHRQGCREKGRWCCCEVLCTQPHPAVGGCAVAPQALECSRVTLVLGARACQARLCACSCGVHVLEVCYTWLVTFTAGRELPMMRGLHACIATCCGVAPSPAPTSFSTLVGRWDKRVHNPVLLWFQGWGSVLLPSVCCCCCFLGSLASASSRINMPC